MYKQRLMKQASQARKNVDPHFLLIFNQTDILSWKLFLHGPDDSPYSDGIFEVNISLTTDYPFTPPKLHFKNKIFHPNVHWETGQVCLDIIKAQWTPNWTLEGLCRAVRYLLQNPNADSPLNCDCGNMLRSGDIQVYKNAARMYTNDYALSKQQFKTKLEKGKCKKD